MERRIDGIAVIVCAAAAAATVAAAAGLVPGQIF